MLLIPQRLLGEALLRSAKNNPSKTAIIAKGKEYSYQLLLESAQNLGRYLINAGINKGDRVAIYMENSWETVVSIYGATLAGASFLMINQQTKADKLKYILNDSEAKVLICSSVQKNELSLMLERAMFIRHVVVAGEMYASHPRSHTHIERGDDAGDVRDPEGSPRRPAWPSSSNESYCASP